MRILDSSLIITIFDEICKLELIDRIIQLGYSIAIPAGVYDEIREDSAFADIIRLVEQDKIQILTQNTKEEIITFQKNFRVWDGVSPMLCYRGVATLSTFRSTPMTVGFVTGGRSSGMSHDTVMRHLPSGSWRSWAVLY